MVWTKKKLFFGLNPKKAPPIEMLIRNTQMNPIYPCFIKNLIL